MPQLAARWKNEGQARAILPASDKLIDGLPERTQRKIAKNGIDPRITVNCKILQGQECSIPITSHSHHNPVNMIGCPANYYCDKEVS